MLKSMVAILFSLAAIAENASRRSPPVRLLLLWLLRRGVVIGMRFVGGVAADCGYQMGAPEIPRRGVTNQDALFLSGILRELSEVLAFLLPLAVAQWNSAARVMSGNEHSAPSKGRDVSSGDTISRIHGALRPFAEGSGFCASRVVFWRRTPLPVQCRVAPPDSS